MVPKNEYVIKSSFRLNGLVVIGPSLCDKNAGESILLLDLELGETILQCLVYGLTDFNS